MEPEESIGVHDLGRSPRPPRLTRRGLLHGLAAGAAGLAVAPLVAACGATPTPTPLAAATTPTRAAGATTAATTAAPAGGAASPARPAGSPAAGGSPAARPAGSPAAAAVAYTPPAIPAGQHRLQILMWSHFVPKYDEYFDAYAKEWGSRNNVQVTTDHVPTDTVVTRAAAEVAANAGHDIVEFETGPDVQVYADKAIDVTRLAQYLGAQNGGWLPVGETVCKVRDVWKGIPSFYISFPGLYRKDLFDANNLKPVDQWEDLVAVGKALKPKANQAGFAISACGDSNSTLYAVLWSYGASTVDRDGKTIIINSPETKTAIEAVVNIYKEAMTPEVLSWDNNSNNRLLTSSVGSWIHNPISAYRSIPDPALLEKVHISPPPAGPKARVMNIPLRSWVSWQWSREQPAIERFLVDYYAQWKTAFEASTGYNHPLLRAFEAKPMPILGSDPKLQLLQDVGQYAATVGYPGPPTAAAGQVNNTYVVPNMFAKAVSGSKPEEAIAEAERQIRDIYQKNPPA